MRHPNHVEAFHLRYLNSSSRGVLLLPRHVAAQGLYMGHGAVEAVHYLLHNALRNSFRPHRTRAAGALQLERELLKGRNENFVSRRF